MENLSTQRALVVGATGYVGNAVVQHLLARGIETTAHIRPESRLIESATRHFEALGASVVHVAWTPADIEAMLKEIRPTLLFACLGTTKARRRRATPDAREKETYQNVDYGLTRMVIDASVDAKLEPKIIYLSAMGASRRAKTEYMFVRGRLEHYLEHCGLNFVIARPGLITGDDRVERRPIEKIAGKVSDSFFSTLGTIGLKKLRDKYTSFTAFELADALVELAVTDTHDRSSVEADVLHKIVNY